MIEISLLGFPQIKQADEALSFNRRKSVALLAYLAVTAQPHSRDALGTLFWPDYDTAGSRANLRRILFDLNKDLREPVLLADRSQVSLDLERVSVDVRAFRRLVEQYQHHSHPDKAVCSGCLQALTQAASLYSGDFMSGFSLPDSPEFDDWQFFESENLRQLLAETLQQLIDWRNLQGHFEDALQYARRWLSMDPLHEPAQRQVMMLYALADQQPAALRQFEEFRKNLDLELGSEPEEETFALYDAIRKRQILPQKQGPALAIAPAVPPVTTSHKPKHNLPAQTTRFIGRGHLMDTLSSWLLDEPSHRLVTLLGPGGSGKTRLAVETGWRIAEQHSDRIQDGVWFVPLAPLRDPNAILPALANSLGMTFTTGQDLHRQQLINFLQDKTLLLLLDNFEHLIAPESVDLVGDILAGAKHVKVVVTSRIRLGLSSENLFPVPGLDVRPPDFSEDTQASSAEKPLSSAVLLFRQCAQTSQPDFALTPENLAAVTRICELVEGMPLGIELAASWVGVLTPQEIAQEIQCSLDFLETELQDVPERQRSMRAVFDSSWKLLDEKERAILKQAAVFQADASREAVEFVTGASLRSILGLVHKSWLRRDANGRLTLHELSRQYAYEKLQADTQLFQESNRRFAVFYASLFEAQAKILKTSRQGEALQVIKVESQNAKTSWNWHLAHDQVDMAVQKILPAFFHLSEPRNRNNDLHPMVQAALGALHSHPYPNEQELTAILLTVRGAFFANSFPIRYETFGLFLTSDQDAIQQAWAVATKESLFVHMGYWGILLAYIYGRVVDVASGIEQLRVLAEEFKSKGDTWEQAASLSFLGMLLEVILYQKGDLTLKDEIQTVFNQATVLFGQLGDQYWVAHSQRSLGQLLVYERKWDEAINLWRTSQKNFAQVEDQLASDGITWQIVNAYIRMAEFDRAFQSFKELREAALRRGDKWEASILISWESLEMTRYGNLEEAKELRVMCLVLAIEVNDLNGQMWNYWELGEIFRLMGDLNSARTNYEELYRLARQLNDPAGIIFYHRGLGDLARMGGNFAAACESFQKSLQLAEKIQHQWAAGYALSGLARSYLGLNQHEMAFSTLKQALSASQAVADAGLTLTALCGMAELYAARGEIEKAVELAALVQNHKETWQETRKAAAAVLASAAAAGVGEPLTSPVDTPPAALWAMVNAFMEQNQKSPG